MPKPFKIDLTVLGEDTTMAYIWRRSKAIPISGVELWAVGQVYLQGLLPNGDRVRAAGLGGLRPETLDVLAVQWLIARGCTVLTPDGFAKHLPFELVKED